ncbi:MAG: hypothetical protein HGA44_04160 [Cellulomonadaceae bacterium]|nr:hypothetical protein [Cellulomonadaceae bacterium]
MHPPGTPVDWVLASPEPAARWIVHAHVLPGADHADRAAVEHRAVLHDPMTRALVDRLPDWVVPAQLSGHQSPAFGPNLLALLAEMGVQGGDDERVDRLLDAMLDHQLPDGRFEALAATTGTPDGAWSTLLCDTHAITDVLLRFGRGGERGVARALETMLADITATPQGPAWPCRPEPLTGFRGPGRRGDVCPQVTLEALRAWSQVPEADRPPQILAAARVVLGVWRARAVAQPHMFGHGYRFKVVKWPTTWYDVLGVLDTLGRFPALWRGPDADPDDRRSVAELVACLVAYNVAADGTVTPQSCYRGFEDWSFGQKSVPSPFATARVLQVLHRLDDLADDAGGIDVTALTSSKGGTGTARPPRVQGPVTT